MMTTLRNPVLAAGAALGLLITTGAQAALVLNLDTTTKDFWFTGSASGTGISLPPFGLVGWSSAGVGAGSESLTPVTGTQVSGLGTLLNSISAYSDPGGNVLVSMTVSPNPGTLTGLGPSGGGSKGSYSGWTLGSQANLEAMIGNTLMLGSGSGFGDLDVVAVPEPGQWVMMSITALGAAGYYVRRHRNRA